MHSTDYSIKNCDPMMRANKTLYLVSNALQKIETRSRRKRLKSITIPTWYWL